MCPPNVGTTYFHRFSLCGTPSGVGQTHGSAPTGGGLVTSETWVIYNFVGFIYQKTKLGINSDNSKHFPGITGSSRAWEFHPHPLTEPCVKVSPHTALHTLCFVYMLLSSYPTERPSLISLAVTATSYMEGSQPFIYRCTPRGTRTCPAFGIVFGDIFYVVFLSIIIHYVIDCGLTLISQSETFCYLTGRITNLNA